MQPSNFPRSPSTGDGDSCAAPRAEAPGPSSFQVGRRARALAVALLGVSVGAAGGACSTAPVASVDELRAAATVRATHVAPASSEAAVEPQRERTQPWTLDEVLARIASATPTLARARERVAEARAALREARASYLPELALAVNYVATDEPAQAFALLLNQEQLTLGPGFDATPGTTQNWREELRLEWALFAPGRAQTQRAAREGELAASLASGAVENRLLNAGVQAWIGLGAARALEQVAWDSVRAVEQRVAQTRLRAREGAALEADVLRLEVRAAAARDEAARAHLTSERARHALAALMGVSAEELGQFADTPVEVGAQLEGELSTLLVRAGRERQDLAALAHRARVEGFARQAHEAARLPTLGVFASYALDSERLELDTDLDKYVFGVGLRLPLSARTGPRIDGARARERGAALDVHALALEVEREVRDAWAEQAAARQSLELAQAASGAAQEAFRVLALAQDAGGATVTDVLEAQDALNRTRVRLAAASAGVQLARARLVGAIGGVR